MSPLSGAGLNVLQPLSSASSDAPCRNCRRVTMRNLRSIKRPSFPAEDLEHLVLHGDHLFLTQSRVDHVVLRARPGTAHPQDFLNALDARIIEIQALAQH